MEPKTKLACYAPFQQMQICVDGKVVPCCHYQAHKINYPELGNVNDSTLMEIWNGEAYQKLRAFFLSPAGQGGCPGCYEQKVQLSFSQHQAGSLAKPVTVLSSNFPLENAISWKNYHLLLQELDEEKTELTCKPGSIFYFSSCSCNFNCVMCAQHELRLKNIHPPERTEQEVMDLLPYLVKLNIEGGEPFIQPIWRRILNEYSVDLNPCLQFTAITNGSMLTRSFIDKLSVFPSVSLSISFDATTKELFDSIRVSKVGFETVYANLLECIKERDAVGKEKFDVDVVMVIQKINIYNLPDMLRLVEKLDLFIYFIPLINMPIPSSLIHYNNAPEEIQIIKSALSSTMSIFEDCDHLQDRRNASYRQLKLIEELIPYSLMNKDHLWVEGTISQPFPQWFKNMYGDEKPYILFFPIEDETDNICQYYAPVENWRYKIRIPEGKYRVALTKYHIAAGPWSNWIVQVKRNSRSVITLQPCAATLLNMNSRNAFKESGIKALLKRVPGLPGFVHAMKILLKINAT
jgi:MoaA/NifB/PqqE/SkfB family radical SAM enzyme